MRKQKSFAIGYSMVINSMLAWWVWAALTNTGMNAWIPAFVGKFGWERTTLLNFSTVGSLLAVISSLICAWIVMKKGTKWITVAGYIMTGIFVIIFGRVSTVAGYALCVIAFQILSNTYGGVTTNTVISNWFPKRKAVVLGITTIGMPLASFCFVPLLTKLLNAGGISSAFLYIGVGIIILGIVNIFWLKDRPQDVGLYPDNIKPDQEQDAAMSGVAYQTKWTLKKLLLNKNAWLIAVGYGILFLVTQGMVSQTVSYLIEFGFAQPMAVTMLSVCAAIGMAGSFIWGVVDQKTSTKKASLIFAVWFIVTFILLGLQLNLPMVILGLIFLGLALGGSGNLLPSMIITTYGPKEFASANRIVYTLSCVVRSFAFMVMAVGLRLFGTYKGATWILMILSVVAFLCIIPIDKKDRVD